MALLCCRTPPSCMYSACVPKHAVLACPGVAAATLTAPLSSHSAAYENRPPRIRRKGWGRGPDRGGSHWGMKYRIHYCGHVGEARA